VKHLKEAEEVGFASAICANEDINGPQLQVYFSESLETPNGEVLQHEIFPPTIEQR
jgi:hypothetical protein